MSSAPKQKYQIAKRSLCSDIWHWLISDPWRKLVALVLAFFTWAVLNLNINRTGNHRWGTIDHIPLTFLSPQAPSSGHYYFDLQSVSPQEVSLSIAVDAWSEIQLTPKDFCVQIHPMRLRFSNDGKRTQPLEATYTLLETDLIEKPDGVTLRSFTPPQITFKWDNIIGKEIPVTWTVDDRLPRHLTYRFSGSPKVFVMGPAFLINQIETVETTPVLLDQQSTGIFPFEAISLHLPGKFSVLKLSEDAVSATVEILDNRRPQEKLLKDIRLNYLNTPDSLLLLQDAQSLPRTTNIYVAGPAGVLAELDPANLMALSDLTGYSMPGPQDVPIRIMNLPPEVHITAISPSPTQRIVLVSPSSP